MQGYEVHSSHNQGDITLYRLSDGRKRGNLTALKCPDIYARKPGRGLVVEIELKNRPSLILGDFVCVSGATHVSVASASEPEELPPTRIAVIVDDRGQRQGSRKPQQFEILREILPAGEKIYEPWLGTPGEFFSTRF